MSRFKNGALGYVVTINIRGEAGIFTVYFTEKDCEESCVYCWTSEETSNQVGFSGLVYNGEMFEDDMWSLAADGSWVFPTKNLRIAASELGHGPSEERVEELRDRGEDDQTAMDVLDYIQHGGKY